MEKGNIFSRSQKIFAICHGHASYSIFNHIGQIKNSEGTIIRTAAQFLGGFRIELNAKMTYIQIIFDQLIKIGM